VGDKLVSVFQVSVNGRHYNSAPGATGPDPGQPITLDWQYTDNEPLKLTLTLWDGVSSTNFAPEFNRCPNPLCNPTIPVIAYAGWEGTLVKVFDGFLIAKKFRFAFSQTEFYAAHQMFNLKKHAKVNAVTNQTGQQFLSGLASQEGLTLQVDASAAGDDALTGPCDWFVQMGESPAQTMQRYCHEFGYVTNSQDSNIIVLRADKVTTGTQVMVTRGDGQLISMDLRYEQKTSKRAAHRRGHVVHHPPAQAAHSETGTSCGGEMGQRKRPPATARRTPNNKTATTANSLRGVARRLEHEGDEATFELRLIPTMKNQEVIVLSGYGPDIDGEWETSGVQHRVGQGAAKTSASCYRAHMG
jgi:hypothetical protein